MFESPSILGKEMPKMKSNAAAKKRFKKTKNGFKRKKAFKSHILTKMSAKRKRQLRGTFAIDKADEKSVAKMLPGV